MDLEKILSAKVLLAINVAIILATELTGSLFFDTGTIHIIALFFLVLGVSRIFVHYNAFDRFLRPLTLGAVGALLVFALSHLTEFISFGSDAHYSDELYIDVTNLYMTAMLLVALSAQYFIYKRDRTLGVTLVLLAGFLASFAMSILGFLRIVTISIEPNEPDIYIYSAVVLAVSIFCIDRMVRIGRAVSIMHDFAGYIAVAFGLIAVSAMHYSLYEILEHAGISEMQIIYIGHFFFYAALSLMFLAFPKLATLGGIYAGEVKPVPASGAGEAPQKTPN